jgi:hypothetical protein
MMSMVLPLLALLLLVASALADTAAIGNCSDPRQYKPSPFTHKQHPVGRPAPQPDASRSSFY